MPIMQQRKIFFWTNILTSAIIGEVDGLDLGILFALFHKVNNILVL